MFPTPPTRATLRRIGLVAGSAALLTVALPQIAQAHVVVSPGTAAAGSFTVLSFRVPDESATASTVAVTVDLPADHPFASVSVRRQPGWTVTLGRSHLATPVTDDDGLTVTEAVTSITWRADASAAVPLGEYAQFDVSAGPVPDDVAAIAFPALQTYSDGTTVRWDDATPPGGAEPEHPAPLLHITAAATAGTTAPATGITAGTGRATAPVGSAAGVAPSLSGTGSVNGTVTGPAPETGSPAVASPAAGGGTDPTAPLTVSAAQAGAAVAGPDTTARVLAAAALVVAAAAVLLGALAVRRRAR